ncbi:ATP-dependent RNA helicase DDX51 [Parasteatoda tepidariorum]|uniref:ATP-dependent RNA helicase DDX51 n=1 Tax=Parasteatoda tepidariorum TaxID=114398 RepID=UPI001C71F33E|nr:ATP-dependent RNA helicase DDX51 [Parasteatoda tepidariorum]
MADGLFLMQRYYGSDEESKLDNSEKKRRKSNELKRKRKTSVSENEHEAISTTEVKDKNADKIQDISTTKVKHKKADKILDKSITKVEDKNADKIQDMSASKKEENNIDFHTEDEVNNSVNLENNSEAFCVIGPKRNQNIQKIKPNLPKWIRNPSIISIDLREQEIPISDLKFLDDSSKKNLTESGIKFLFPVQLGVIPWLMQNNHNSFVRPHDLCVSAPTGSGKTLAFVIPIVESLKERTVCAIRAVVVLPVSELAMQVCKVFELFVKNTDLKVVLLTGQKSFQAEQNALIKHGTYGVLNLADIVVTTPGRILDHIQKTEGFTLQHLRYLVIDEADRMVEDILKGWLTKIQEATFRDCDECACFSVCDKKTQSGQSNACRFGRTSHSFQKLLYSATLSHDPEKLHSLSLYRPKLFIASEKLNSEYSTGRCSLPENLILQHIICETEIKPLVLCHFIKKYKFKKILCFTESVERANRLQLILEEMGLLRSREISSNYRPVQRKIILKQFNSKKIDVIVCSDLVARGIDIEGVDCVVSYDVPPHLKTYVHRVGRTARAGKGGTAVALVSKDEFPSFKKMLSDAGMALPINLPVNAQHLKEYAETFQKALQAADAKFRKQKNTKRSNASKKTHRRKSNIKT